VRRTRVPDAAPAWLPTAPEREEDPVMLDAADGRQPRPPARAVPRDPAGRRPPAPPHVYAWTAALTAAALGATAALEHTTGTTFFGLVLAAVAVIVWLGGLGPALAATSLAAAATALLPVEPVGRTVLSDRDALVRWALFVLAALVITGFGHVMRSARDRAEASERNLAIVSAVHEALEPSLEVEARLRRLAGTLAPGLCDWCAVRIDGDAAATYPSGDGPGGLPDPAAPVLLRFGDGTPVPAAVAEAAAAAGREPASAIVVPFAARGTRLGVMVLATWDGRRLGAEDLAVAEEVARRAALQVDNARLYEAARSMSASLERSDALKTAMLRGVSHEFRTPLTAIAAAAAALEHAEGEERRQMVAIVEEEAGRLERLVTNLLDLSRLEGGVLRPRLDECSVAELVAGARAAATRFLTGTDIRVDVDPEGPLVRADPVLTERVLVNLIQNATRHGAPPVRITVARRGDRVEVVVADAGPGVPDALRATVFDQFVGDGAGLGIGLALSRRLAEAQGAELALLDDGPGAAFALRLPVAGDGAGA
jgi:two-component system sensor histidine kinase KdpD